MLPPRTVYVASLLLVTGACTPERANPMVDLLAEGEAVFGIFSGDKTPEQAARMARITELDFVFYSLESGPFDIPTMQEYMKALTDSSADGIGHPVALRVPPIRGGHDAARWHVREGLAAGVASIVFPHVETVEDATLAVSEMSDELWPGNPDGRLVNMLLIEDSLGLANVRDILSTNGVSIVFPGPGDLRRLFDGDMEAVENAIQHVLAACKEFHVPCGITATADDVAERLEQGFRVFIMRDEEGVLAGLAAAGRTD